MSAGTGRPLEAGERVLLQDLKGRRYLVTLERGGTFHTHKGRLAHDRLIGAPEGEVVGTDQGQRLLVLRPTFADWVVKMPRGAQVIYPRVIALMVMAADVRPGLVVAEAGAGSGALSIALLQAVAATGRLVSFELRPDFADQARRNVEAWFGKIGTTSIHIDFEVRRKENPDQVVASGKYIVVAVKKGEFAPTPVPQTLREKLAMYVEAGAG